MWQRFTEPAKKIVLYAQIAAGERGKTDVAAEHLLLGLLREVTEKNSVWPPAPTTRADPHDIAASLLRNVDIDKLRADTDQQIMRMGLSTVDAGREVDLLPSGKCVIDAAYKSARQVSSENITPEFLLLGLFGPQTGESGRLLTQAGLNLEDARRGVASIYQPAQKNRAEKNRAEKDRLPFWSRLLAKRPAGPSGEKKPL